MEFYHSKNPEFVIQKKDEVTSTPININNLTKYEPSSEDSWIQKFYRRKNISGKEGESVYKQTCQHYNTSKWIHLHPQYSHMKRFIPSASDLQSFINLGRIRCSSGRDFKKSDLEHFSDKILSFFREGLFEFGEVFIRFSHKSFKNSFSIKLSPLTSLEEILDALTSSHQLLKTLDEPDQEIFMMKWVEIDRSREYRVFIIDSRLVGISQQNCYSSYDCRDREKIVLQDAKLIYQYYQDNQRNFDNLNFQIATLDIFIGSGREENEVNLIEVNPPSLWGPSGSSLFEENDFQTKFTQENKVFVIIR